MRSYRITLAPEETKHSERVRESHLQVGIREGLSDMVMFEHTDLNDKMNTYEKILKATWQDKQHLARVLHIVGTR